MSIKLLIDMNLSPDWVPFLEANGWAATHWSQVGKHDDPDQAIMQHAAAEGFVVLTLDLDFGTMLALTRASRPSVVQIRTEGNLPPQIGQKVISVLRQYEFDLDQGALLVIDVTRNRIRKLPSRTFFPRAAITPRSSVSA